MKRSQVIYAYQLFLFYRRIKRNTAGWMNLSNASISSAGTTWPEIPSPVVFAQKDVKWAQRLFNICGVFYWFWIIFFDIWIALLYIISMTSVVMKNCLRWRSLRPELFSEVKCHFCTSEQSSKQQGTKNIKVYYNLHFYINWCPTTFVNVMLSFENVIKKIKIITILS